MGEEAEELRKKQIQMEKLGRKVLLKQEKRKSLESQIGGSLKDVTANNVEEDGDTVQSSTRKVKGEKYKRRQQSTLASIDDLEESEDEGERGEEETIAIENTKRGQNKN